MTPGFDLGPQLLGLTLRLVGDELHQLGAVHVSSKFCSLGSSSGFSEKRKARGLHKSLPVFKTGHGSLNALFSQALVLGAQMPGPSLSPRWGANHRSKRVPFVWKKWF